MARSRKRRSRQAATGTASERTGRRRLFALWGFALLLVIAVPLVLRWRPPVRVDAVVPNPDLGEMEPEIAASIRARAEEVDREPTDGAAWGQYGMILLAYELNSDAAYCFDQAENLEPTEFRWPYYQAICRLRSDPVLAVGPMSRAAFLAEGDPVVRTRTAELLYDLRRYRDALIHVRAALDADPGHVDGIILRARLARELEDLDECVYWARLAVEAHPSRREGHEVLANALHELGEIEESQQVLADLERIPGEPQGMVDPYLADVEVLRTDTGFVVGRAESYLERGQIDAAVDLYERLVIRDPDDPNHHGRLIRAWIKAGNLEEASRCAERALARIPGDVELTFQQGVILLYLQEYEQANERFVDAIAAKPDFAEAYFNRGLCLRALRRPEDACEAFAEAVRIEPSYAEAHFGLGTCLREMSRTERAIASFHRAVQLRPDNPEARVELAEILIEAGRRSEAREHIEVAVQLAPGDPKVRRLRDAAGEG